MVFASCQPGSPVSMAAKSPPPTRAAIDIDGPDRGVQHFLGAQADAQALGDLLEDGVRARTAQPVVDEDEVLDFEDRERDLARLGGAHQSALQRALEALAVREAGQRVDACRGTPSPAARRRAVRRRASVSRFAAAARTPPPRGAGGAGRGGRPRANRRGARRGRRFPRPGRGRRRAGSRRARRSAPRGRPRCAGPGPRPADPRRGGSRRRRRRPGGSAPAAASALAASSAAATSKPALASQRLASLRLPASSPTSSTRRPAASLACPGLGVDRERQCV